MASEWGASELGETENWVRVIEAEPGASVLVCWISCGHCQLPESGNVWQSVAMSGTERQWPCIHHQPRHQLSLVLSVFSLASKLISAVRPPILCGLHIIIEAWLEVCQGPWEAPLPILLSVSASWVFMAWPSDNTKFGLDYLGYFEISIPSTK